MEALEVCATEPVVGAFLVVDGAWSCRVGVAEVDEDFEVIDSVVEVEVVWEAEELASWI